MSIVDELLKDILSLLQNIQKSRKGSIGTINNVYLPQLSVDNVNELALRVLRTFAQKEMTMFEIAIRCQGCGAINEVKLSAPEVYPNPLIEFNCQSCNCPLFMLRRILTTVAVDREVFDAGEVESNPAAHPLLSA